MKIIPVRFLVIFLVLTFSACKKYVNKDRYIISVGEELDLYYSTNSCCYYCITKEEGLKHITFSGRKTIDEGPNDCVGCNFTAAYTFRGKSVGIDTIELKLLAATMSCEEDEGRSEKYIIEVR